MASLSRSGTTAAEIGVQLDPWVLSGFLTKRGESRKNWKRRFMVLHTSGMLRYYKAAFEEGRKSPKPCGQIDVGTECVSVVEITKCDCEWPLPATANNAFGLATDNRIFFLVCESDAACSQWIRLLKSRLPSSEAGAVCASAAQASDACSAVSSKRAATEPRGVTRTASAQQREESRWRQGRDPSFKPGGATDHAYEEVVFRNQAPAPSSASRSVGAETAARGTIQYHHVPPPKPDPGSDAKRESMYAVPSKKSSTAAAGADVHCVSDQPVYSSVTPATLRLEKMAPTLPSEGGREIYGTDSVLYSSLAFSDDDDDTDDDERPVLPPPRVQIYENVVPMRSAMPIPAPSGNTTQPPNERRRYVNVKPVVP
eukprot:m.24782 g.24782  ORF g.24782 m.24782 type:complete len:370 (-) comp11336_c0_seq1:1523-2632(-)